MKKEIRMNKEQKQADEIRAMYEEMLHTENKEKTRREELAGRILEHQKEDGSWRSVPSLRIERDCLIHYAFFPTYYATAALMHYMNMGGKLSKEGRAAMAKGLSFAQRNHLRGHGYDATRQQLTALNIYKEAGLYTWLKKNTETGQEFAIMVSAIINGYREGFYSGHTYSDWDVDFADEFIKEVEEYEAAMDISVWYAAYGSNINSGRFSSYINRCQDQTMPAESRKYIIPHNIYFAYSSRQWGRKGVAFLDDSREGMAFGKTYKITAGQLVEIQRMEGNIYGKKLFLGMENGTPIYTFTAPEKRTDRKAPSPEYLDTIYEGLCETYADRSKEVLALYLYGCGILDESDKAVLFALRNSAHGLKVREIADRNLGGCITKTRASVKKLAMYGMVRQDRRSIAGGDRLDSEQAVIYTEKEKRNLIDMLLLDVR